MAMRFASLLPAKVIRFSLRPVFLRDVFNDTKKMRRFPGKNVTAEQIAACAQKAEAAGIDTSSPNISIGTWYDKNSDTTFLDVSLTTADRERAIALAQQFRQKNAIPIGARVRRSPACHRSKIALRFSAMKAKLRLAFPNEPPLKRQA